jgi:hypothetical protein
MSILQNAYFWRKIRSNYMQQSFQFEGYIPSAGYEIPRLQWSTEVYNSVHNISSEAPNQSNTVHMLTTYLLRSILILSSHLSVLVACCHAPRAFVTKILHT